MKAVGLVALALGLLALGGYALLGGLLALASGGMCGEWTSARVPSPDGRHVAVVRHVDCGATTSVASDVEIEPGKVKVFSCDGAVRKDGEYGLDVQWLDDRTLVVAYHRAHWSEVVPNAAVKVVERPDLPPDRP